MKFDFVTGGPDIKNSILGEVEFVLALFFISLLSLFLFIFLPILR